MLTSRKFLLVFLLAFLAIACNLPRLAADAPSGLTTEGEPVAGESEPDGLNPLESLFDSGQAGDDLPGEQALWGAFPGPSVYPDIEIPAPVARLPQPKGQVNLLLLGSDQRPDSGGFRTDTILLLTVNPGDGTATLTSFPRDLFVYIPGWTMQRINTAQAHGGWETTQQTFEYNFGVRPDGFVLINFWSFKDMVDSLGGISVEVAKPFSDHRDGYGAYNVPQGQVQMDGETALWYARARYSTSDFDRTRRQQEVLLAIFQRLVSLDAVRKAPELLSLYQDNVVMNLNLKQIASMMPLALQIDKTSDIRRFAIGPDQVNPWKTPGGAQVLLPKQNEVLEIMQQALNSS